MCTIGEHFGNDINNYDRVEVTAKPVSSRSVTESEVASVIECKEANMVECKVTNVKDLQNDIQEHMQESMEQMHECLNIENNLHSVSLMKTDCTATFAVGNDLEMCYSGSEGKEDNKEMSSNDISSASDESQYTCGMCGISLKTMDLLKEHALNIHGIKYIVIEGSDEDSFGKHPDSAGLDSVGGQYKQPREGEHKEVSAPKFRPPTRLRWILPKPFTKETKATDLLLCDKGSETIRTDCHLCGKQFQKQSKYEVHKYVHLDRKHWPLACPLCQKHFITKSAYSRHLMSVHEVDKTPSILKIISKYVPCGVCGKRYKNAGHLRRHVLVHHEASVEASTKAIKCEQCDKLCSSEGELQRHVDRIHLKVRRCLCTVCGKKFFDGSALKAHSKIHWEVKPYPCGYCDKRFADTFEVKRHERGHTGEKPHVCEICGKAFRQGYFLNVHLRSHTGEKPYGCNICGAAFTCKSTLRNHKLIHVDVKAFDCTHCRKSFRTSIQLYNHVRLHTRPFKCEVCSKGFSSRIILNKHVRTHDKNYTCQKCGTQFTALLKLSKHEKECSVFESNVVYDLPPSGE
jgi:uncharacterized Zn-finger protein